MADMIKVRSLTDGTVSLYDPTIPVRKLFEKRGSVAFIEKDKMIQLYYNSSLQDAMRQGMLVIDDKDFLYEVGYIIDKEAPSEVIELDENLMKRCIGLMPVAEFVGVLKKLSSYQIQELVDYAIEHNRDLRMDRIEILDKVSGKNILRAIELYKAAQEG